MYPPLTPSLTHPNLSLLQVLDLIGPPYSSDFVALFLPIVTDEEITPSRRGRGHTHQNEIDPVADFIRKPHPNYILHDSSTDSNSLLSLSFSPLQRSIP